MVFLTPYNSVKSLKYRCLISLFRQPFVFCPDESGVPLSVAICATALCRISTATGAGLNDCRTARKFWTCISIVHGLHCCVRGGSRVPRTTDDPTPWYGLLSTLGLNHGGTPTKKSCLFRNSFTFLATQFHKILVKQRYRFNAFEVVEDAIMFVGRVDGIAIESEAH